MVMVMVFLPKNYHLELQNQFTTDFYKMAESLEKNGWEDMLQDILRFLCEIMRLCGLKTKREMKFLAVNISNDEKDHDAKTLSQFWQFQYKRKTTTVCLQRRALCGSTILYILVSLFRFINRNDIADFVIAALSAPVIFQSR